MEFQGIYYDSEAKEQDRIVLFKDRFPDHNTPRTMLTSLRLCNTPGLVVGGPAANLDDFRNTIKEKDKKGALGKDFANSLINLQKMCNEFDLVIMYTQNMPSKFRVVSTDTVDGFVFGWGNGKVIQFSDPAVGFGPEGLLSQEEISSALKEFDKGVVVRAKWGKSLKEIFLDKDHEKKKKQVQKTIDQLMSRYSALKKLIDNHEKKENLIENLATQWGFTSEELETMLHVFDSDPSWLEHLSTYGGSSLSSGGIVVKLSAFEIFNPSLPADRMEKVLWKELGKASVGPTDVTIKILNPKEVKITPKRDKEAAIFRIIDNFDVEV